MSTYTLMLIINAIILVALFLQITRVKDKLTDTYILMNRIHNIIKVMLEQNYEESEGKGE